MKPTHAVIEVSRGRYGVATIDRADSLDKDRIVCLTLSGEKARDLADRFNQESRRFLQSIRGGPSYPVGPVPACSNEELSRSWGFR